MGGFIITFDRTVISWLRTHHTTIARISLGFVFGWFGFLKLLGVSPANQLIIELLGRTLPFMGANLFFLIFGLYEMLIGVLFLVRGAERAAIALLVPHFFMTSAALFLVPTTTWSSFLVPTLEGQYILKNLVLIALAFSIAAQLHPLKPTTPANRSNKLDKRR